MMKKIKLLLLPLAASALTLAACGQKEINHGPELWGVNDIICLADTTVDLLDGVAALDLEDGDITPNLRVTVTPEVPVENGYTVFPAAGEYEVCYEAYDSQGKYVRTTVGASVKQREVYTDSVLTNGFSLNTGGKVEIINEGLNSNVYSFKVTGNEIAEDVKLSREYTLVSGVEYTFAYHFDCNASGRIKCAADGFAFAERNIAAGSGQIQFTYSLPYSETADGQAASDTVLIELWLGGLDGEMNFSLSKCELSYLSTGDGLVEKLPNFDFNGKTEGRFDGTVGTAGAAEGGKGVFVEISKASADTWRGGVFVNTGLNIADGVTYKVSYDVEAQNDGPFEVILQNKQWDANEFHKTFNTGHSEFDVTINAQSSGTLWIYIASGANVNRITLKNLSVKAQERGTIKKTFEIGQVYSNNSDGGEGSVVCEYGRIIYDIKKFGANWGNNELGTPSFALSGAAGNFVITFKAKASSPVNCVFAASAADYWDTFVWKQLKITEQERTYSVRCDDKSVEGNYKFLWQFGSSANSVYSDVKVEISDLKICYLSELEG